MKEFKPPWGGSWTVKGGIIQKYDGKSITKEDAKRLMNLGFSIEIPKKKKKEEK